MDLHTEGLHSLLVLEDTLDREVERLEEELIWHRRKRVYLQALGCSEDNLGDLNITICKSEGLLATMKHLLQQTYLERKICSEELQTCIQERPPPSVNIDPLECPSVHISKSKIHQHRLNRRHHQYQHQKRKFRLYRRRKAKHSSAISHHLTNSPKHHSLSKKPLAPGADCCSFEEKSSKTAKVNNSQPPFSDGKNNSLESFCSKAYLGASEDISTKRKCPNEIHQGNGRIMSSPSYRPLRFVRRKTTPKTDAVKRAMRDKQSFHKDGHSSLPDGELSARTHLSTNCHLPDNVKPDGSLRVRISTQVTDVITPVVDLGMFRGHDNSSELYKTQSQQTIDVNTEGRLEIAGHVPYSCYSGYFIEDMVFSTTNFRQG